GALVVVDGEGDLLEVVEALGPGRGGADLLDRGQQQPDKDGDDGDDDEQFDQRKSGAFAEHDPSSRERWPTNQRPPGLVGDRGNPANGPKAHTGSAVILEVEGEKWSARRMEDAGRA